MRFNWSNTGNLTRSDSWMKVRLKVLPDYLRGGAWPSPVRAVRCSVKSDNERDPRSLLPADSLGNPGTLRGLPSLRRRKERATAGQYAPDLLGHTRLQWLGQWDPTSRDEGNPQTQPQLGSRAATRPREHGIPSNRVSSSRGEYVPAPCTHRPSLHPSLV